MSVQLWNKANSNLAELELQEKLTKEDYEEFVPELEKLMAENDDLRLLVKMKDFEGWSLGALWEDVKFDAKHFNDVDRLAFVGDEKWQEGMAAFCKPFTTADVKYFKQGEDEKARNWLTN